MKRGLVRVKRFGNSSRTRWIDVVKVSVFWFIVFGLAAFFSQR